MITIIVVTFNASKYIIETLNSILKQSFKDYEVIIIDDGSTDGTIEIINNYSKYSNFKIIIEKHSGNVGRHRNNAVKISRGNYIAFLDSDDIWYEDKLEIQSELIRKYDLVCSNVSEINNSSEKIKDLRFDNLRESILISIEDLLTQNMIITSSVLIKKDIFLSAGSFDEKVGIRGEDYILWLNVAKNFRIYFYNKPLVNYRIHQDNLSWRNDDERIKLLDRTIEIRQHFITALEIRSDAVNKGFEAIYAELIKINYRISNYSRSLYYSKTLLKIAQNKFSLKYLKYLSVFIFLFMISKIKG